MGITHGHTRRGFKSSLYSTWSGMKQRCNYPNHIEYHRYGARGIKVCPEWEASFAAFVRDMGPKPTPKHQLERIDNSKGYEPGNVKWVTPRENSRNTRKNHFITFNGETLCLMDWSERTGIDQALLRYRIKAWGVERALTTPVRKQAPRCT